MKKICVLTLLLPVLLLISLIFVGCSSSNSLLQYVSEYRSDIFMATEGKYSIFANYYERENPYKADGHIGKKEKSLEVALATEDNTKNYAVTFMYNGVKQQNILYYDSLQMIHSFVFHLDSPKDNTISFQIFEGKQMNNAILTLHAKSVKNNNVLSLNAILSILAKNEKTLIDSLMQNKQFLGEIHIRLLFEENYCYYYVSVVDRKGKATSLLVDGELGEILAKRES